ncbi:hypothetical protein OCHUTO_0566 [Orientia chuto str. Dubai]|uniref:Uncharacterized protein n=1 Tax=Orientia chuto str. Dubai TaxID=1359168 RepID=A0A0F3ML57_9RICK|nr:hypothetical protein OCHUTO_0566 [Orientia chuto str. Dubai]
MGIASDLSLAIQHGNVAAVNSIINNSASVIKYCYAIRF